MQDHLHKLKDVLDEAQTNSKKMMTKLQRFEDRLGSLEEKMKPIQVIINNNKVGFYILSIIYNNINKYNLGCYSAI